MFFSAFTSRRTKGSGGQTPFAVFVKKLQESLTRMESFEVVSVGQSADGERCDAVTASHQLISAADSKRSSPSLLARQLRLRLVAAEDSDVPRNLNNIVVSIHAIATFQALHDYLWPRVSGLLSSSSRLTGMLAALAASGLGPSSRFGFPELSPPSKPEGSAAAAASSSAGGGGANRRRSLRLSAKKAGSTSSGEGVEASAPAPASTAESSIIAPSDVTERESMVSATEPAPSETVVNDDEFAADFTDEEVDVDAEVSYFPVNFRVSILCWRQVIDDDDPDNSMADKTINLSVGEGSSHVISDT